MPTSARWQDEVQAIVCPAAGADQCAPMAVAPFHDLYYEVC